MLRTTFALFFFMAVLGLRAQTVFIPDLQFRAELNQRVPGLVPANGQMPVNNDAMVPSTIFLIIDWTPSDLTGLEYLQGLVMLDLQFDAGATLTTLPVLPPTLRSWSVKNYPANMNWPLLPSLMNTLFVDGTERPDLPVANGGFNSLFVQNAVNVTQVPLMSSYVTEFRMHNTGITSVSVENEQLYSVSLMDNPFLTNVTLSSVISNYQCEVEIRNCAALTTVDIQGAFNLNLIELPALTTIVPLDDQLDLLGLFIVPSLQVVPELPVSLHSLIISEAPITIIPVLPPDLLSLSISSCPIALVPALPATLEGLVILTCPVLEAIPTLPQGLNYLTLQDLPLIIELPTLPGTVSFLSLHTMPFPALPNIPGSLDYMELVDLEITELPPLNAPITGLTVTGCPLVWLPSLPGTLTFLQLTDLPLTCLPTLPMGLVGLGLSNTQVTCLPNHPPGVNTMLPLCTILNTRCPEFVPYVSGRVFRDANVNGMYDAGEQVLPYATVLASPSGYMTGTDSLGRYILALPIGSYALTVDPAVPYVLGIQPEAHSVQLSIPMDVLEGLDFAVEVDTMVPDLRVYNDWTVPLRPGFQSLHRITISNQGTTRHNVEVTLQLEPWMELQLTSPQATVNGTELSWSVDSLALGEVRSIIVDVLVPASVAIGTPAELVATISPFAEDVDTLNNVHISQTLVVGSFDPNDKQVSPTLLNPNEGVEGRSVEYLIRFQNTGTAAAERVLITDTLSEDLDPTSFSLLASSHACTWFYREGALHFLFDPISLPDSTANEPGSHGFVAFEIDTRPGLPPGAVVLNEASIYFDFNEPVITEPCDLTVLLPSFISAQDPGGMQLYPTPTKGLLHLRHDGSWTNASITMTNALGSMVLHERVTGPTMTLDLSNQPTGIYLLRVGNVERSWSRKLVKE